MATEVDQVVDVTFNPGDGIDYIIKVKYISDGFARGEDGSCAFCHGDPCDQDEDPTSMIHFFWENMKADAKESGMGWWIDTCPCCNGRPT